MELVYLWVEKYKNIEKQGFNFSPRFECHYDEKTNELAIDEKEHIKDFFGKNINITAIVGENGSGKSTITEILGLFNFGGNVGGHSFLVFKHKDNFSFVRLHTKDNISFKVILDNKFSYDKKYAPRKIFCTYFANEINTFLNNPKLNSLNSYANFNAFNFSELPLMDNNKHDSIDKKLKNKIDLFNKRFLDILKYDNKIFYFINEKFVFDSYRYELHMYELGARLILSDNEKELFDEEPKGFTLFQSSDVNDTTSSKSYFYKYIILKRLLHNDNTIELDLKKIVDEIKNTFKKQDFSIEDYKNINIIIDKYFPKDYIFNDLYDYKNIEDILENYEYVGNEIWVEKQHHKIKNDFERENNLLKNLIRDYNRTNFFNDENSEYNYLSLSSGEREYLNLLTHYIYELKCVETRQNIFIFDEPDSALHPNWQKRLIKDFLHYANKFMLDKEIYLLMTSHSPFILSDLPKENVIFLEKDKDTGDCKNATKDVTLNPFGANIHTLLSHGFFMKDGLMGEFAKGKINAIKEFYEKVKKSENPKEDCLEKYAQNIENFKNIHSIIGEPFLKTIIGNYLDELHLIFSDDSTIIDKELQELEARQRYLKSLKK
ncbi:AAA family ATPase [Sulfurimonas sp. CS5]|uniref:AAA family ATPase n=1 Tax=Sulfurimonas sp. CS5 TaxID=3391145 RepID=UPI0039EB2E7A